MGQRGDDGVVKYNWPLARLSVDWVRQHFGPGRYQANWLVDDAGRLVPRGRSRVVELDTVAGGRRSTALPPSIGYAEASPMSSPPPPAPSMPPDVVDMRVRAAEEIAAARLKAEREIHVQRMEWERERSDERFSQLEQRIEQLGTRRRRDDDDDDAPDEWAWLKDLGREFAPVLRDLVPTLLAKLGGTRTLPGG
jgi:hypothetical protein